MEVKLILCKVAMVHVPKTAGTTLNSAFRRVLGNGHDHIESMDLNSPEIVKRLQSSNWFSGHIPLHQMRSLIKRLRADPVRIVTSVREPVSQVASHYNWLIEIGRRSPQFFDGHPEEIKDIHRKIVASDNSNPRAIIANLQRYKQLFLNVQSRYVIGDFANASDVDWNAALQCYDAVITDKTLGDFLSTFEGSHYASELRENTSPYHFDKAVFRENEIIDFLNENNGMDFALYKIVQSEGGRPN